MRLLSCCTAPFRAPACSCSCSLEGGGRLELALAPDRRVLLICVRRPSPHCCKRLFAPDAEAFMREIKTSHDQYLTHIPRSELRSVGARDSRRDTVPDAPLRPSSAPVERPSQGLAVPEQPWSRRLGMQQQHVWTGEAEIQPLCRWRFRIPGGFRTYNVGCSLSLSQSRLQLEAS